MKSLTQIALVIASQVCVVTLVHAGTAKDFFQNSALNTSTNYSPTGLPNTTTDVRLTTPTTGLTLTASNLTLEWLSAVDGLTRTVKNNTGGVTNSTITLGSSGGCTNGFSGVANDLIYSPEAPILLFKGQTAAPGRNDRYHTCVEW